LAMELWSRKLNFRFIKFFHAIHGVPDFRWPMKNGDSSTCLACIVYNWEVNSRDDNKRLVMGKKSVVVTSLHGKLFDPQAIQTSRVVEFRSSNANSLAQLKTKIISHVYYYINLQLFSHKNIKLFLQWLLSTKGYQFSISCFRNAN
jgi:hypothetical protein